MVAWKDICSSSSGRTPKSQLTAEQPLTEECWIAPKKDTPHPRAKEKPQQDSRRGKTTIRIKPHTRQRCSEGSNKPCMYHDPDTPKRLSQNGNRMSPEVIWSVVSCCRGREPPELTQDWGNRLLEGTIKTLCAPGPRRKEQTPQEAGFTIPE